MKAIALLTTASALLPSYVVGQAQDDYINWIRQIQTETNAAGVSVENIKDVFVESRGTGASALGIPVGGAFFQLWTLNSVNNESWLLDTATVGANRPEAEIVITARDSHGGVARTRADIPFTVTTNFFNLQAPGEGVAPELTQVRSYQYVENSGTTSEALPIIFDEKVTENGTVARADIFTSILPEGSQPAYKAKGIEHFAVEMISNRTEELVITTEKIEVYPLTTGELGNFDSSPTIRTLPEYISLKVEDPYPGSEILSLIHI